MKPQISNGLGLFCWYLRKEILGSRCNAGFWHSRYAGIGGNAAGAIAVIGKNGSFYVIQLGQRIMV